MGEQHQSPAAFWAAQKESCPLQLAYVGGWQENWGRSKRLNTRRLSDKNRSVLLLGAVPRAEAEGIKQHNALARRIIRGNAIAAVANKEGLP